MKPRGTSSIPLLAGILGVFASVPPYYMFSDFVGKTAFERIGYIVMVAVIFVGALGSMMGKPSPRASAHSLAVASLLSVYSTILVFQVPRMTLPMQILTAASLVLFIIAAIAGYRQRIVFVEPD